MTGIARTYHLRHETPFTVQELSGHSVHLKFQREGKEVSVRLTPYEAQQFALDYIADPQSVSPGAIFRAAAFLIGQEFIVGARAAASNDSAGAAASTAQRTGAPTDQPALDPASAPVSSPASACRNTGCG